MSLFLPFENFDLTPPQNAERWLAAGFIANPPPSWRENLTLFQPFRPSYLALKKADFHAVAQLNDENNLDGALLQLGRHKKRNEADLAELLKRVKTGSPIIISGDKLDGIDSFLKKAKTLLTIENSFSKNHGRVFYFLRPENITPIVAALTPEPEIFDGFKTRAGMFSHGRVDAGSAELIKHFSGRVFGRVADFGAGWGYLSAHALQEGQKLSGVDLYEADFDALEAAKINLVPYQGNVPLTFHWHDMLSEPVEGIYDTVISNPPFHEGRKADPTIGQHFINVAARRLKPGGRLLMVANRNLPYEATLKKAFKTVSVLGEPNGFKIIEAIR